MEHRCGRRVSLRAALLVESANGSSSKAVLHDVSASGALLESTDRVPIDAQIRVVFLGRTELPRLRAQVVRHCQMGFAIEWAEFSPDLVDHLLSLPRTARSERPSTLQR
jgi:PilZ domain-containing protein